MGHRRSSHHSRRKPAGQYRAEDSESHHLAHWRRIEMRRELEDLENNLREVWDEDSDPEVTLALLGDHPDRFYTNTDPDLEMDMEGDAVEDLIDQDED